MEIPSTDQISQWLPFLLSPLELEDFLGNNKLYPSCLPLTEKGFYLEMAFFRSQLSNTEAPRPETELTLTSKFLSAVPNPGLALLLALDVFQPKQIVEVFAEKKKTKEKLGTVVSLTEVNKKRKGLGKVEFTQGKKQTVELKPEQIVRLVVGGDTKVELAFYLKGAKVLGKTRTKVSVTGGKVGVVIDSRGRPIEIGEGEKGWEKIKRWTRVFI